MQLLSANHENSLGIGGRTKSLLVISALVSQLTCFPSVAIAEPLTPSFNCNSSLTPIESMICKNDSLALDDRKMFGLFQTLKQTTSTEGQQAILVEQRRWFADLKAACGGLAKSAPGSRDSVACIDGKYRVRIGIMTQEITGSPPGVGEASPSTVQTTESHLTETTERGAVATGTSGQTTYSSTPLTLEQNGPATDKIAQEPGLSPGEIDQTIKRISCQDIAANLWNNGYSLWVPPALDSPGSAPFGVPFGFWGTPQFSLLIQRARECGDPVINRIVQVHAVHQIERDEHLAVQSQLFNSKLQQKELVRTDELINTLNAIAKEPDITTRQDKLEAFFKATPDLGNFAQAYSEYKQITEQIKAIGVQKEAMLAAEKHRAEAQAQAERDQQQKVADEARSRRELLERHQTEISNLGYSKADLKTTLLVTDRSNAKVEYSTFEYFLAELLASEHVSKVKNDSGLFGQQISLSFESKEEKAEVTLRLDHVDDGLLISEAGVDGDIKQLSADERGGITLLILNKRLDMYPSVVKELKRMQ